MSEVAEKLTKTLEDLKEASKPTIAFDPECSIFTGIVENKALPLSLPSLPQGNINLGTLTLGSTPLWNNLALPKTEPSSLSENSMGCLTLNSGTLAATSAEPLVLTHSFSVSSPEATICSTGNHVTLNGSGVLNRGSVLTVDGTGSIALTGTISGPGAINQTTGTLILSGMNTYLGGTTVSTNAILQVTRSNALPANTHLTVNGIFDLNGFEQKIKNLGGNGTILLNGGILTVESSSFTGEFSGPGLVESSTGKVLYSGNPEEEDDHGNDLGASMKL